MLTSHIVNCFRCIVNPKSTRLGVNNPQASQKFRLISSVVIRVVNSPSESFHQTHILTEPIAVMGADAVAADAAVIVAATSRGYGATVRSASRRSRKRRSGVCVARARAVR